MEWTERRWKILMLLCLILALIGAMSWMGVSFKEAILGGIEDAQREKAQKSLDDDKQKLELKRQQQIDDLNSRRAKEAETKKLSLVPKPETSPKSLGQAITDAVPRGATSDQIEAVAGVFRDVADLIAKKKDFKDPETGIDVPPTPKLVLQRTRTELAQVLGSATGRWESFSLEMGDALAVYFSGLNKERGLTGTGVEPVQKVEDFIKPWNEIADGLVRAKPKG